MTLKKDIQVGMAELVKTKIKEDLVSQLMLKFENEIVSLEDASDPMRPSVCKEEFRMSLEESIDSSLVVTDNQIKFGIGDENKLGFGRPLSEDTTDCDKIIGTILQGIVGEYVLVTTEDVRERFPGSNASIGRTGKAHLIPRASYDDLVEDKGWKQKPSWGFSNFKGIPDFFDDAEIDMDKYIQLLLGNKDRR